MKKSDVDEQRLKTLEAQRADDAATIKGLVKRAEAKLALADRLAEAMRDYIYRGHFGMENVKNALAAYEAGEPVVHPDAAREGE
jgi:uncharacterized coiled-coil protein SlyX